MADSTKLVIVPKHVAIIMDGNGRWAKSRGLPRVEGHRIGAQSVRAVVEEARRQGVRYLTLFSFSTENWNRPKTEVSALMKLFAKYLESEFETLAKNGVRLRAIGDLDRLPGAVKVKLDKIVEKTAHLDGLDLILALSYGSRLEIVEAAKSLAGDVLAGKIDIKDIDEAALSSRLYAADVPDPDLLIRTSGENRISNFLLWQLAYSEIVVTQDYWPDFRAEQFRACLKDFAARERRFGKTSEQLKAV